MSRHITISSALFRFLIVSQGVIFCTLAVMIFGTCNAPSAEFYEISVQRINVVNPDGKTVLAISNKQRVASPAMGGKTYPLAVSDGRENMAGMIFFNQEGDEMGGLLFNSFKLPNGKYAGIGHLSFDRYSDNQVLALQYKENASTVQSGLTLYDRPADGKFKQSLDLIEEAQNASPERVTEIQKALGEWSRQGALGVERVFVGSRNRTAQLLLKDSHGRPRARLLIDESDEARLEFLDEKGEVKARFP